jgi:hypothetical protein
MVSDIHPFPSEWVIVMCQNRPAKTRNGVSTSVRNESGWSMALAWSPRHETPLGLALLLAWEGGQENYHIDKCKVRRLQDR